MLPNVGQRAGSEPFLFHAASSLLASLANLDLANCSTVTSIARATLVYKSTLASLQIRKSVTVIKNGVFSRRNSRLVMDIDLIARGLQSSYPYRQSVMSLIVYGNCCNVAFGT